MTEMSKGLNIIKAVQKLAANGGSISRLRWDGRVSYILVDNKLCCHIHKLPDNQKKQRQDKPAQLGVDSLLAGDWFWSPSIVEPVAEEWVEVKDENDGWREI